MPTIEPANLSAGEIQAAIPKLEKRLVEAQTFSPEEAARQNSPESANGKSIIDKIDQTLVDIFGPYSIEYKRYKVDSFYSSGGILFMSFGGGYDHAGFLDSYQRGKSQVVSKIETALEMLKEKLADMTGSLGMGIMPMTLDGIDIHPSLQAACSNLYRNQHYTQAVETACKVLNGQVQSKSGRYDQDNVPLMQITFSANKPILAFNEMKDEHDVNEQKGMMHLYEGIFLAFRNQRAHKLIEDDAQTAFGVLTTINFLIKLLDKAKKLA
jgi:uncharacterized protein (TIGR02391 family)